MKTLAILINIFFPGVGTLIIGKVGPGIAQILIYGLGLIFTITAIGAIFGLPMMLGAWIWGIVTAAGSEPQPIQVTVNNNTNNREPYDKTIE